MAPDYAVIRVQLDAAITRSEIDLYNAPDVISTGPMSLGQQRLDAGHTSWSWRSWERIHLPRGRWWGSTICNLFPSPNHRPCLKELLMLTRIAALIVCVVASSFVLAAEHTKDSLATIKKSTEAKDAILVDVRELDEWKAGHVTGATFLPLSALEMLRRKRSRRSYPRTR